MRLIDADALLEHQIESDKIRGVLLVVSKGYILDAPTINPKRQPDLETGLMPCGCGGKAQIWPSDPTQFTHVITDYEVGCTECAMTTGWVRGKQENAIKVWNTAMGWKGGAE